MSVRVKPVGLPRRAARIVCAVTSPNESPNMKTARVFAISPQLKYSRQVRYSDNGWPIREERKDMRAVRVTSYPPGMLRRLAISLMSMRLISGRETPRCDYLFPFVIPLAAASAAAAGPRLIEDSFAPSRPVLELPFASPTSRPPL